MSDIKDKLKQAETNEITFSVSHKGKEIYSCPFSIPPYAEEVFADEVSFYYFFKKVTAEFKEKIDVEHKRLMFASQGQPRPATEQ